ncbi:MULTISPECIES: EI24 domain-containing protein [Microbacterium]|uniref:EI24 domain-containing protein n=1 Tax=Microbacterium TaxID=33882 RepID=UPI001E38BD14|nr:EI24 domain-containing protein [Microbacterium nymphoidis]MCD2499425.1 EI24 domain-containing protein [Microbacterium nymphoidis]
MQRFIQGALDLFRAAIWWRREPKVMALALVPAVIAGAILLGAWIAVALTVPAFIDDWTPFLDSWPAIWSSIVRVAATLAVLVGTALLASVVFVALTLALGDPFYERVWRAVEISGGGEAPDRPYGIGRSIADGVVLVLKGVLASLVAAAVGLIPVVGAVLGPVVGVLLTGRVLADELTSRALTHRGLDRSQRREVRRRDRARVWGFGAATQLLMLIPLAPILVLPTAVAGATVLSRRLVGEAVS